MKSTVVIAVGVVMFSGPQLRRSKARAERHRVRVSVSRCNRRVTSSQAGPHGHIHKSAGQRRPSRNRHCTRRMKGQKKGLMGRESRLTKGR
jgi:hypothetical protein